MSNLKQAALDAARRGFPVFPVAPGAASPPLIDAWPQHATTDPATIERWWDAWPDANPAIHVGGAGVVVVDLDEKGGKHGIDNFFRLELDEGAAPATFTVETPSGGQHLYFKAPINGHALSNSVEKLASGVDIRAGNGYVVAPGAITDKGNYTIQGDQDPAPLPEWVAARASARIERQADATQWAVEPDDPRNVQRARDYLEREAAAGRVAVEGQGGNNFTYRTAALLRDFGVSEDTALDLLITSGWNEACVPPWHPDELEAIVSHAYDYANRPGGAQAPQPEHLDAMWRAARKAVAEHGAGTPPMSQADQAHKPSRFKPLTPAELAALPPPQWMVADCLPEQSLSMIYGKWGTYKSFIALDMALSLSTGTPFLGMETARPYRAVFVAGEGSRGLSLRIRAWLQDRGTDPGEFYVIQAMPAFMNDEEFAEFLHQIDAIKPEFVVLDTTAYAMVGLDENSTQDSMNFVNRLTRIQQTWGCSICLIHHSGKDEKKGSRGNTSLPGAMDTIFETALKGNHACLTMDKQKDAEKWAKPMILAPRHVSLDDFRRSLVFDRTAQNDLKSPETLAESYLREVAAESQSAQDLQQAAWAAEAASILSSLDDLEIPIAPADLARKVASAFRMSSHPIRYFLRDHAWKTEPLIHYSPVIEASNSRNRRAKYYGRFRRPESGGDEDPEEPVIEL